ncbi:hypothetical protein GOBAR_DD28751 [Gossypium barbadense]|nr:hypothetical protein GOBAR_DD28751 [Gossypium barbadense]
MGHYLLLVIFIFLEKSSYYIGYLQTWLKAWTGLLDPSRGSSSTCGFAHYGPYWRNMRKLAMVELLSSHWLELLKHVDDNKIGSFIKELQNKEDRKGVGFAIGSWVNEHREWRLDKGIKGNQDFIDAMLSIMDENNVPTQEADVTIRPNCLQQQVEESDIANLVYLQAIIKETMRLYPAAPVSVVREAMDNYTVANFHIPAGTQLLLNLWKLHRDPRIWHKPLDFLPERFLSDHANIDVRGQNFELIPFGAGRRICPGITFAFHFQHLALAQLLHGLNGEWSRIKAST